MSEPVHIDSRRMSLYMAGVLLLIGTAGVLGLWLGKRSVPVEDDVTGVSSKSVAQSAPSPRALPLYLYANVPTGTARDVVAKEIALAADSGIHQYVLPVVLPWQGDLAVFVEPMEFVLERDPAARFLLRVTLDPPVEWLGKHPEDAARVGEEATLSVSLASEAWADDAQAGLEALVSAADSAAPDRIEGYILACLDGGQWYRASGYDASEVNTAGFREWLKGRYADDAAFQTAWGAPEVTRDTAAIPSRPDTSRLDSVFLELPKEQNIADFLQFTSDRSVHLIKAFTTCIKQTAGKPVMVLANYGYSYELGFNHAGHWGLGQLLDSDVDGFASPVSYLDRGLGGTGAVMGPVDTVVARQKKWVLIDDTRTGIAFDAATNEIVRPKNVRPEDVYSVQQRNFGLALTHGLGLAWSDAQGDGQLCDEGMWARFAKMADIYGKVDEWKQTQGEYTEFVPKGADLAVVVDEGSRMYQRCDEALNDILLRQTLETVVRTGACVRFHLLDDVLEQRVKPANVYLFLNAFHLTADERGRLHKILEDNSAAAIWLYAPGYFDTEPSVENISATTRMDVKAFDEPARMGSVTLLSPDGKAKSFGTAFDLHPAFYVDDPKADPFAEYAASNKVSIAVRFFSNWASVYCAEPSLPPAVLREILGMLEVQLPYRDSASADAELHGQFFDAMYCSDNLMVIHARESGERVLDLREVCHVRDLVSPEISWQRKRTFGLHLRTGDTRILRLTPIGAEEGF